MTFIDTILRIILGAAGWACAFFAGRVMQASETWIFGQSERFMLAAMLFLSAVMILLLALL